MIVDETWVLEMMYAAKYLYDGGCWDTFTAMFTQNVHEYEGDDVEVGFDPRLGSIFYAAAISSVFETVKSYYNEERQTDIVVFWDPLMYRFNKLCREYEAQRGIVEIENPYVREMEQAIHSALNFGSFSYDYRWTTGTKNPKDSKLVWIEDPEFSNSWEIPRGLVALRDFYVDGISRLEAELTPKKRKPTSKKGKLVLLPAPEKARWKEAA